MTSKILVAEDDPHTAELVRLYLTLDGYEAILVSDGHDALQAARAQEPALVVLDLMLPGLSGLEVCRQLRQESDIPIIMLTALVGEENRLEGLDLGADDYVTKPFSPRELAARVRAVLRRAQRDAPPEEPLWLEGGGVRLNLAQRAAWVNQRPVYLTATEFHILSVLLREPGRVFTREQIIQGALGREYDGFDRTIDSHVSNLRRKLEAGPKNQRYIQSIYGVGYRFTNV